MRVAAFADFNKLWGKIDQDLPAGDYELRVDNNFDVSSFDGEKRVVLMTTTPFGGDQTVLSILYLVFGFLCLVYAVTVLVLHIWKKNRREE